MVIQIHNVKVMLKKAAVAVSSRGNPTLECALLERTLPHAD